MIILSLFFSKALVLYSSMNVVKLTFDLFIIVRKGITLSLTMRIWSICKSSWLTNTKAYVSQVLSAKVPYISPLVFLNWAAVFKMLTSVMGRNGTTLNVNLGRAERWSVTLTKLIGHFAQRRQANPHLVYLIFIHAWKRNWAAREE